MRTTRHGAMAVSIGALVLAFSASAGAAAPAEENITDQDITNAVETEFVAQPEVRAYRIDATTVDGVVTLDGTARSLLEKRRAVKIARSIEGVESVVDRIEVAPAGRSDTEIREDVRAALIEDAATEAYELDVRVSDGVAHLSGSVDSWAEARLAREVASSVRGVRDVTIDDVRIEYDAERTDEEIEADVRGRLASSVWVDDYGINVAVDDGHVRLTGYVGSAIERWRAHRDAYVAGVERVDSSELKVKSWARDEMRRESRYADRNDRQVRKAIMDALVLEPRVLAPAVDVQVSDGRVTLTGEVTDLAARRAAADVARNTIGVRTVNNLIDVRPDTDVPTTDDSVERRIEAALARDAYTHGKDIDVTVENGMLTLRGEVPNTFIKRRAEMVAERVEGVIFVENQLDAERRWTWQPDREIREAVRTQLFWSPFVDRDDVTVAVNNGVVTLTGTVETWAEYDAATENAFEAGAKEVNNDLMVTYE